MIRKDKKLVIALNNKTRELAGADAVNLLNITDDLKNSLNSLENRCNTNSSDISSIKNRLDSIDTVLSDLRNRIETLENA